MNYDNIPTEIRLRSRWVTRRGKVPICPATGEGAKANDPTTWGGYEQALQAAEHADGIGFELGEGIAGIDIDTVRDPASGWIDPTAREIIETMDSYTEVSPSGYGVHILFFHDGAALPSHKKSLPSNGILRVVEGKEKQPELEAYTEGRYFTMTGDVLEGRGTLCERSAELREIAAKYLTEEAPSRSTAAGISTQQCVGAAGTFTPQGAGAAEYLLDEELVARIKQSKSRDLWETLFERGDISAYNSDASAADMALCNLLAFWTGCDAERMDGLFRQSALMRAKWDERHFSDGRTYGQATIAKAVGKCSSVYDPDAYKRSKAVTALADFGDAFVDNSRQSLSDLHPDTSERYSWSDIGNGYLFADWYKGRARYVPERKQWFIFDGRRWAADVGNLRVMELCKQLADALLSYAVTIGDEKRREDYIKHISKWQRRNNRETILKDAAGVYSISMTAFDQDPYVFNCLNGTLDLRNGSFREHCADDLLSKVSGVNFDPEARCERWERFIDEVMQGDRDKAAFFQKALGYALTGSTKHECFFILYGATSRNGKSTAMSTFGRLMGEYGRAAKPETISQKYTANGGAPSEDIARLAGARFVNISEPDKQMKLSAATVKTMTGNDTINARYLNENSFEFTPQFKLFINTNHLPTVTDVTLFSSDRVKIIPFERHFTEEERDEHLKDELSQPEALSAVLNWAIQGLRDIDEVGFSTPESVIAATQAYKYASDKMGRFIEDTLEESPLGEIQTTALYAAYQTWCTQNGHRPEAMQRFKDDLQNYGTVVRKRPQGGGKTSNPVSMLLGYEMIPNEFDIVSVR